MGLCLVVAFDVWTQRPVGDQCAERKSKCEQDIVEMGVRRVEGFREMTRSPSSP